MAKYKIIPSSRTIVQSPISIGHKAEKGVEAIEFDLTAWVETYGSGTLTVIMRRWGDAIPYPIALEIDENNKATWTLSDIDTAKAGMAYAQLSYIVGETVVKKSDIYTFRVMDSLTGEGDPPEAYESWLEHLTHLAAEAMAEVLDIEGIVTDKTLTVDGGIADGKATGDALALKADKSTTYTKTEVDQMIEDVEVETDTTLEIAGAPADAAETGRQIGLIKADLGAQDEAISSAETRMADYDGVISTKWEIGGVSPNSNLTPPVTYVTIANAIRTPRGTTIHLKAGDIISLTDYSDCKVGIYGRKTSDDSYSYYSNVVTDVSIAYEGDYVIEIRLTDSTATADIEDLSSRVSIKRPNNIKQQIGDMQSSIAAYQDSNIITRMADYDGVISTKWEIGGVSPNSNLTPPVTYVTIANAIRTPRDNTIHLDAGDTVSLTDYSDCKVGIYGRKTADDSYTYKSNVVADTVIDFEGDYVIEIRLTDSTATADVSELSGRISITGSNSTKQQIRNVVAEIGELKASEATFPVGNLMPDIDDWMAGRVQNGNYDSSVSSVKCTDYIPVVGGKTYYIYGGYISSTYFGVYDDDKTKITEWSFASITSKNDNTSKATITLPNNAAYIRINLLVSGLSTYPDNAYVGLYPTCLPKSYDLSDYVPRIKGAGTLSNCKILVVGDSISTDVYGRYNKWVTALIESGFFTDGYVTNNSQHATGYVATYRESGVVKQDTFKNRLSSMDLSSFDLIVTFGGINDFYQNVPWEDFTAAVDDYYEYLVENATQARIAVLSPLRTSRYGETNSIGKTQKDYADYIKSVADFYALPVLNLTDKSGFCPDKSDTFKDMWTIVPSGYVSHDGVHPTMEWEYKYLAPQIAWFLAGLIG